MKIIINFVITRVDDKIVLTYILVPIVVTGNYHILIDR